MQAAASATETTKRLPRLLHALVFLSRRYSPLHRRAATPHAPLPPAAASLYAPPPPACQDVPATSAAHFSSVATGVASAPYTVAFSTNGISFAVAHCAAPGHLLPAPAPSMSLLRSVAALMLPYRVYVSLHDRQLLQGTLVTFNRVMNLVLHDCVELHPQAGRHAIGSLVFPNAAIASMTIETSSPPPMLATPGPRPAFLLGLPACSPQCRPPPPCLSRRPATPPSSSFSRCRHRPPVWLDLAQPPSWLDPHHRPPFLPRRHVWILRCRGLPGPIHRLFGRIRCLHGKIHRCRGFPGRMRHYPFYPIAAASPGRRPERPLLWGRPPDQRRRVCCRRLPWQAPRRLDTERRRPTRLLLSFLCRPTDR